VWHTYRLAEIQEKKGNRAEAVRLAEEVFELNPNHQQRDLSQGIIGRNR